MTMEKQMEDLKQQLKQQEKLASLGLLSAGIAHEIQNPLNFVINFSKMSDKLLSDLTEIVEDNEDKLSDEDRYLLLKNKFMLVVIVLDSPRSRHFFILRILRNGFGYLVTRLDSGIVFQHIKDKALVDGLTH